MLRIYRMPNGRKYQYEDNDVPDGAVLVEQEKKVATKVAPKPRNKSKKTENK